MNWEVPIDLKTNFISGYTYHKLCKWSVCPRYFQKFDPNEIKENDLVFLNLDFVERFAQFLNMNPPNERFRLITQNSDRPFTEDFLRILDPFCSRIYPVNSTVSDHKISKIPLGYNDQSSGILDSKDLGFVEKKDLIWLNFRKGHHPSRIDCLNYFIEKSWVSYRNEVPYLSVSDYYDTLKNFKYCISPRGAGIDTHRIYESLIYGVIPVVKSCELDDLYKNFPILLVDDWSQVTREFLEDNYKQKIEDLHNWTSENKNWFLPEYWIK